MSTISELGETSSRSHGRIMETFFKAAMRSDWEAVKELSKSYPDALCAQEAKSGHTAVSLAVLDGQDKVVEELVNLMKGNGLSHASRALGTEDDGGNTPLHYAAAIGSVGMCRCIAEVDSGLIGRRNHDGETPLYLAVLHCEKRAFLCLHYLICRRGEEQRYRYCRRNDGDTILHCAINAEYLDFACQIIRLYPRLANSVNQQGLSPLHILAAKPSAFRSGSQVQGFNKFIYLCIYVHHTFLGRTTIYEGSKYKESVKKFPENYQACFNFAWLLKKLSAFFVFGPGGKRKSKQNQDEEDPNSFLGSLETEEAVDDLLHDDRSPCFYALLLLQEALMQIVIFLGSSTQIMKIEEIKQKHVWSKQVLDVLLDQTSSYKYEDDGRNPQQKPVFCQDGTAPYSFKDGGDVTFSSASLFMTSPPQLDDDKTSSQDKGVTNPVNVCFSFKDGGDVTFSIDSLTASPPQTDHDNHDAGRRKQKWEVDKETAILIAAKNGVVEMVDGILKRFPLAAHDKDSDDKNIVLLAVENRGEEVYRLLLENKSMTEAMFRKIDRDGNTALHLAAKHQEHKPWLMPGPALEMQWEIKWYEFVRETIPNRFNIRLQRNKQGKSAEEIFTDTHKDLVKRGGDWLAKLSESCSTVAGLTATVTFATSSAVPGGLQPNGTPNLESQATFCIFAMASLIALCTSITALALFLTIRASRFQESDFRTNLPLKLLVGLTSLSLSSISVSVSFCAGHFFIIRNKLKYAVLPIYAVTIAVVIVVIFSTTWLSVYSHLLRARWKSIL